jgi:hypothetical protein
MMRRILLLGLLIALVPAARADEAALPPLSRSDLELLPFDEAGRLAFLRDHGPLVFRVEAVLRRLERVDEQLAERARETRKADGGAVALGEERVRLSVQAEALVPEIEAALAVAGLPADALTRARRAPRGPQRAERFGRAQVLEAPGLTPAQRARFEHLVPAVDGAAATLEAAARRLRERDASQADDLDVRRRAVEERFWRVAYWLLDEEQRTAVCARLPHELRKLEDGIEHFYLVRGLTPSQGVAFKALLLEVEAEAAADEAQVRRASEALARPGLAPDERRRHEAEKTEAERRLVDLRLRARDQGLALFTPEQVREIRALPPLLSAAERREPLPKTLEALTLTPEQRLQLAELGRRYAAEKLRIESGYLGIKRRLDEAGPDSPEREMAEMMAASIGADAAAALRAAHGEVFLDVLTPPQIEAWVLGL